MKTLKSNMQPSYEVIDGVKCYAPHLAFENADYPTGHFNLLFELESKNFWFRARNNILINVFSKFCRTSNLIKVLEIGCGTGYVLSGLSKFKNFNLFGAEVYLDGLKYAKQRLPDIDFLQADIRSIPFKSEFDAVGAFDVLEHIDEDTKVMQSVCECLKPGGLFFISVPQHKWLWSSQDETALHKRRYSRKEIIEKLEKSGFLLMFVTSFVFTLFPLMFLSRFTRKNKQGFVKSEYSYDELILPPIVNSLFRFFMYVDEALIKMGFSLPFGGSLLIVARKKHVVNEWCGE